MTEGIGFEPIAGADAEGAGGDIGLDGADGGTTGLTGGTGFISLTGKFGGILISGVRGLAAPFVDIGEVGIPLGFGGVIPLRVRGFNLTGDGEGGGVVDPETGGLISSAISAIAKRKT